MVPFVGSCFEKGDTDVVAGGVEGETPCERYCNHVASADCLVEDCDEVCVEQSEKYADCGSLWDRFHDCAVTQRVSCNSLGEPVIAGCDSRAEAVAECVEAHEAPEPGARCGRIADDSQCTVCCYDEFPDAFSVLSEFTFACGCVDELCRGAPGCEELCLGTGEGTNECLDCVFGADCDAFAAESCDREPTCQPVLGCLADRCGGP
jgi:hypothetical protein